ncbi:MAG TPA: hypothetical protein VJM46_01715, partial [Candidatus Saccharimonadales bacterium]|nr:hypothetical protein [Candidatus Saccharimonadales bacterium]
IRGWSSSFTGDDGGGLRYRWQQGREDSIPRQARQIVRKAGGSESNVTSFILWRLDVDFRQILDVGVFAPMTQVIRGLPGVLNTHARGEGLALAGVYIEFRGEPSAALLEQIRQLVAPHAAA